MDKSYIVPETLHTPTRCNVVSIYNKFSVLYCQYKIQATFESLHLHIGYKFPTVYKRYRNSSGLMGDTCHIPIS